MTSNNKEITTSDIIDSIQHMMVRYTVRAQEKGTADLPDEVVSMLNVCIDQFQRMEEYIGDMVDVLEQLSQQIEAMEAQLERREIAEQEF